ncbi:hypothetical protein [Vibrio nomapromontoriensis]|uniref:hypothetical protein n=1 Tax=Vibrio nomapromontoriensis TaxID=2910246 RepID=UPI003D119C25
MKNIGKILIISLLLQLSGHAVAQDIEQRFPPHQVEKILALAFENKSIRYTSFATQFNFCQQKPKHSECGEPYQVKRSNYQIAKGNHDVLEQVYHQEMRALVMPEMAYPDLVTSLRELAYLERKPQADLLYKDTLHAVNDWLAIHDMPQTTEVYFLHALMIKAEALNQQIRDEETF